MTVSEIANMMDISAVQAENTLADIDACIDLATQYGAASIFALPAHIPYLKEQLTRRGLTIPMASVVGFPSGSESSHIKEETAKELVALGCAEVDMVNNITWLKAHDHDRYVNDVRAVVRGASGHPVKVIIECHWLTEEEMIRACEWSVEGGARWVKTGTGWTPTGATPARIALMKKTVGDRAQVKAAGGVRSLETLLELYNLGARRFGIGVKSAQKILIQSTADI